MPSSQRDGQTFSHYYPPGVPGLDSLRLQQVNTNARTRTQPPGRKLDAARAACSEAQVRRTIFPGDLGSPTDCTLMTEGCVQVSFARHEALACSLQVCFPTRNRLSYHQAVLLCLVKRGDCLTRLPALMTRLPALLHLHSCAFRRYDPLDARVQHDRIT